MVNNRDVVIVGGGVAGCSVAYHLALAGVKSTVIEREGIGTQASGFASGGLNPLEGAQIPGPLSGLAIESYRMHLDYFQKLKDASGVDYQGRIVSLLKVAFDDSEMGELQDSMGIFEAAAADGFEARLLERNEVLELEPGISPEIVGGLLCYGNGAVDSYQYTLALATAAERLGVEFRSGSVNGLAVGRGGAAGVLLGDGQISCEILVLAAGPWSRQAETWLDVSIPVEPLKGETLRLEYEGYRLKHDLSGGGGSIYAKPDGLAWCGTTEEWQGFDKEPSESARQSIIERVVRIVPVLEQARLALHTACLRPVTADWLPIVGKAPGWDNVYLATGAGRKGILLSPGMGKAVADLIVDGRTEISIETSSPERFVPVAGGRNGGEGEEE